MQLSFEKKVLPFIQGLSLRPLAVALATSFVLSSLISMGSAYFLIPAENKPKRSKVRRGSVATGQKGLSKEDQKLIIDRNIFNSEGKVGDPTATPSDGKKRPISESLVKSDLPLKVKGIIFSGDPFNGLALLEDTQRRRTKSYVVGDTVVNNARLVEIYETRVIFDRGGQREYIEAETFEIVRSRRKKSRGGGNRKISRIATRPPAEAYKEDGFERKGNEIKLSEEFKRGLLSPDNMAKILQDAKAEPNMVNGELRGFRLTRIRENSVYEKAGFQNNDVVEEINGIPLRDAAGAIRLLQQLKSAKEIEVRLNRGGASQDMNITIQ